MWRLIAIGVTALAAVAVCWGVAHAGPAYTIPSACTFTAADGGVARSCAERLGDVVSVKDFNAKGDGTTDDTTAIQAALNATTARAVFIPAGTYKVTTALTINRNTIAISGAGRFLSIIKCSGAINCIQLGDGSAGANPPDYTGVYDGSLSNLSVVGGSTSVVRGIYGRGARQWYLSNLSVEGVDSSSNKSFSTAAIDCEECYTVNLNDVFVRYVSGDGIWFHAKPGGSSGTSSNEIRLNAVDVFYATNGILITGTGAFFGGVRIENVTAIGLLLNQVQGVMVAGGYFENNTGTADIKTTTADGVSIQGAYFTNATASHKFIMLSSANPGVLSSSTGTVIQGNRFAYNSSNQIGVSIEDATSYNTVIGPNHPLNLGSGSAFTLYGGPTYSTGAQLAVYEDIGVSVPVKFPYGIGGRTTTTVMPILSPITLQTVLQANLGTPANGTLVYCSDCNTASACTAGGAGAFASRQAGAWKCL